MLARPGPLPPDDGRWALEMKWDGVRALAFASGRKARLVSRTGEDISAAYPELRGLGPALGGRQALLDGEIVAFDAGGRPDFEVLQPRIHVRYPEQAERLAASLPVAYLVFDVLHLEQVSLLDAGYADRRELLDTLGLDGPNWHTPPASTGVPGAGVQAVSVQHGLEGIVAKRLDSRYEPGRRSGNWLKIKNFRQQEAVIGGWQPGEGGRSGQIGSLLIGYYQQGALIYAGHVGTGFTQASLRLLGERLAPLRRPASPFTSPVPGPDARRAVWAEPRLVIDVRFTDWTQAGRMRAPSYRGLRQDKPPAEVIRED
jgi:bifunctional non-homologous end joining protein LigD